jgi:hypothetical protein
MTDGDLEATKPCSIGYRSTNRCDAPGSPLADERRESTLSFHSHGKRALGACGKTRVVP